jgi:predicted kinase
VTDPRGILIEFSGLPGTGKSTLARHLAAQTGAVLLRIDEIEAALRRNGLTPEQTGLAAYSVAHDVAASHLRRGLAVIADAVNPVEEARAGWRGLAQDCGVRHVVIETQCLDEGEHRRRVRARDNDVPGWTYPSWERIRQDAYEYQPRTDPRLVVDTTRPVAACHREIATHLGLGTLRPEQNKEFSLHGSSDLSTDIEPNFVYRISKSPETRRAAEVQQHHRRP